MHVMPSQPKPPQPPPQRAGMQKSNMRVGIVQRVGTCPVPLRHARLRLGRPLAVTPNLALERRLRLWPIAGFW